MCVNRYSIFNLLLHITLYDILRLYHALNLSNALVYNRNKFQKIQKTYTSELIYLYPHAFDRKIYLDLLHIYTLNCNTLFIFTISSLFRYNLKYFYFTYLLCVINY